MSTKYEVIVGNIGTVYHGTSEATAKESYKAYVKKSRTEDGRAAGESVTLFADNEPVSGWDYQTTVWSVEYTDTFGGEANYSWVRRATIRVPQGMSNRDIMRRAKAEMGLTGVRGQTSDLGETIEFRPRGSCTVMFITPEY